MNSQHQFWPDIETVRDRTVYQIIEAMDQSQWWQPERLAALQRQQFIMLLNYAKSNTRYYSELLGDFETFSENNLTEDILSSIPYTYKKDIQLRQTDFVVNQHDPRFGETFDFETSGSVGTPLTVKWNQYASSYTLAKTFRYHQWHGSDPQKKYSTLRVLPFAQDGTVSETRGHNWYPLIPGGESVSESIILPVSKQVAWLQKENPSYLFTYPTNAGAIIDYVEKNKLSLPALERIDLYGETVNDELAGRCQDILDCTIADKYSSRELGESATLCPETGLYHVQSETNYLEVRKADGTLAKEGEVGQLIISNLHNTAMPIIRYAIEDYAEVGPQCSCGRGLPTLKKILGRNRNMLKMRNGDLLWPSFNSYRLHKIAPIHQVQLIQTSLDHVDVNIVPIKELTDIEKNAICEDIWDKFPRSLKLNINLVTEIPRSKSGKFEDFRCDI